MLDWESISRRFLPAFLSMDSSNGVSENMQTIPKNQLSGCT
jgi:hypothetical protein